MDGRQAVVAGFARIDTAFRRRTAAAEAKLRASVPPAGVRERVRRSALKSARRLRDAVGAHVDLLEFLPPDARDGLRRHCVRVAVRDGARRGIRHAFLVGQMYSGYLLASLACQTPFTQNLRFDAWANGHRILAGLGGFAVATFCLLLTALAAVGRPWIFPPSITVRLGQLRLRGLGIVLVGALVPLPFGLRPYYALPEHSHAFMLALTLGAAGGWIAVMAVPRWVGRLWLKGRTAIDLVDVFMLDLLLSAARCAEVGSGRTDSATVRSLIADLEDLANVAPQAFLTAVPFWAPGARREARMIGLKLGAVLRLHQVALLNSRSPDGVTAVARSLAAGVSAWQAGDLGSLVVHAPDVQWTARWRTALGRVWPSALLGLAAWLVPLIPAVHAAHAGGAVAASLGASAVLVLLTGGSASASRILTVLDSVALRGNG